MEALVWFRRDLRVRDHPALRAALDENDSVTCVFCLDDRLLHGRHESGPRTQFMLECLAGLDASLRERGGALVVRHGAPERELPLLAVETGATTVHFSADTTPFARRRDARVAHALRAAGVEPRGHPGVTVIDDVPGLLTQGGNPYTVFSPFHRAWSKVPRRDVLHAPHVLPEPSVDPGPIPSLAALGLDQTVSDAMPGGESEARRRLASFTRGPVDRYDDRHDALGRDGTSRLSPYLHFGCVSPREVESRAEDDAFRRQLAWRDFYHHVLFHFPRNAYEEFQERYRGALDWEDDEPAFEAWQAGRTGFPLVDAGMRQLAREGWMHNRARLVVASFLTKDLGVDWRRGERHFMRWLIDGDEANNNGNWQWIASVGVDPQPFYRRMYNPARHMERFDPHGHYVRRYVPELHAVPDAYLREPWTMPDEVQRDCGVIVGRDYPAPIIDRRRAREGAMERYRAAVTG